MVDVDATERDRRRLAVIRGQILALLAPADVYPRRRVAPLALTDVAAAPMDCWVDLWQPRPPMEWTARLIRLRAALRPGGRLLTDVPVYEVGDEAPPDRALSARDFHQAIEMAGLTVTAGWLCEGIYDPDHLGDHHGWFHVLDVAA